MYELKTSTAIKLCLRLRKFTWKNDLTRTVRPLRRQDLQQSLMTSYFLPLVFSCAALKNTLSGSNSCACARKDWCDIDLIFLAKIVKMEAYIRAAQTKLDAAGMMLENNCGTWTLNLLISITNSLERRQLAVIRSMSMKQTANDLRTINGNVKAESVARAASKVVGVARLIAQPMNWSVDTS